MDQIDLSPFTDLSVQVPWQSPCSQGTVSLAFFSYVNCFPYGISVKAYSKQFFSLWYLRKGLFEAVVARNSVVLSTSPDGYLPSIHNFKWVEITSII